MESISHEGLCFISSMWRRQFKTGQGQFSSKNAKIMKWLLISRQKLSLVTLICLEVDETANLETLKLRVCKSLDKYVTKM